LSQRLRRERPKSYLDGSKGNHEQRKCLDKSVRVVGQIYPVLRDAEGRVIDGWHRLDVNPNWKSVTLEGIKTEEDRLIVSLHANLGRRKVPMAERIEVVNALAEIYWDQGLRPSVNAIIVDRDGRNKNQNINEITRKLNEVLKGIVPRSTLTKLLHNKYKNTSRAEGQKEKARTRQENTPAIQLIEDMFGKQIIDRFGEGIFGRLHKEMFDKAKASLVNDPWWMNRIKDELRAEIEVEVKAHILAEYGISDPVVQRVEVELAAL